MLMVVALAARSILVNRQTKTPIGATALVSEQQTGISFEARVDTGAAISSIHCLEIIIAGEAVDPKQNVGKRVRIKVANRRGQEGWIETLVVDFDHVRTSDATTGRYYVRLRLLCAGGEKEALVTLKDRSQMQYKLLLGREFLENDFVVDVSHGEITGW